MLSDMYARDSKKGCAKADSFLGGRSRCLDCPFPDCYDGIGILTFRRKMGIEVETLKEKRDREKAKRYREIVKLIQAGMKVKEIVTATGASLATINRAGGKLCQIK